MARFLRGAARLLVTAGAMSAVQIALAGPSDQSAANAYPDPVGVRLVGTLHVSAGQAHLEAMKVEMAWLGDVATYQLAVEVEVKGEALEVRGQVPDESDHQHALEVARQSCYLPVLDAIRVVPKSSVQSISSESMIRAAREALARQFGERTATFDISVRDHGQVILRGKVSSVEEKLMASRCLRGLNGCKAVVNCMSVTPIKQNGHTITLVTSDGRHAVHGIVLITAELPDDAPKELAAQSETKSQSDSHSAASVSTVRLPDAPATLPSGLPQSRPAVAAGSLPPALINSVAEPVTYVEPASGYSTTIPPAVQPAPVQTLPSYPICTACTKGMQLAVVPPPHKPTLWERLTTLCSSKPKHTESAVIIATPSPANRTAVVASQSASPSTSAAIRPAVAPVITPVVVTEPPLAVIPPTPASSSTSAPNWPPAYRDQVATPAPAGSSYQPKPLLLVRRPTPSIAPEATLITPVPQTTQTAVSASPQTNPSATSGMIRVSAIPGSGAAPVPVVSAYTNHVQATAAPSHPAAAAPVPARTVTLSPEQLRKAVQNVCGKMASEVRVEKGPNHSTIIHVVANRATEQQMIGKLLAMPEITATNVRLEIHVSH